jgi:hypothetical protein
VRRAHIFHTGTQILKKGKRKREERKGKRREKEKGKRGKEKEKVSDYKLDSAPSQKTLQMQTFQRRSRW